MLIAGQGCNNLVWSLFLHLVFPSRDQRTVYQRACIVAKEISESSYMKSDLVFSVFVFEIENEVLTSLQDQLYTGRIRTMFHLCVVVYKLL